MNRFLSLLFHPFYRDPDFVITNVRGVYLRRWHVIPRNRWFNIYLHQFLDSDEDRALHDHPWASLSVILRTGYLEHLPNGIVKRRKAGQMVFRRAEQAHRVQLLRTFTFDCRVGMPDYSLQPRPAWTLFITGPRVRQWGFHCPQGWRHWRDFLGVAHGEARGDEVGRGCE